MVSLVCSFRIASKLKKLKKIKKCEENEKKPKVTGTTTLNDLPNEVLIKIFDEALKNHNTAFCVWKSE